MQLEKQQAILRMRERQLGTEDPALVPTLVRNHQYYFQWLWR